MNVKFFVFILFIISSFGSKAQDFNCNVSILDNNIQSSDKQRVFEGLETGITEFMNNRKWCDDVLTNRERLNCNIVINISKWNGSNEFEGVAQIQLSRPVYGTSYTSTLLNINDKEFSFSYSEGQALEFIENGNTSNLTSLLGYYAYLMLGLDYDSFSLEGGTLYLQKALNIVNESQNSNFRGWKASDDTRNRYWLAENLLNNFCKPLRQVFYLYHRKGLDQLQSSVEEGRKQLNSCLPLLKQVQNSRPNSMALQTFFIAKSDELVNFFSNSSVGEKPKIVADLSFVDPSNISKYQTILKN